MTTKRIFRVQKRALRVRAPVSLAALLSALALTGRAGAAPREHDGFQFRGEIGPGYLSDAETAPGWNATLHGGAGVGEFYFGGTPAPGLVIGGFLGSTITAGPSLSVNGQSVARTSTDVNLDLTLVGPYVDYYPSPTHGFHLMGLLAVAELQVNNGNQSGNSATGFGLGAGIGYDFWASDEWSLGIMGRLSFASLTYSDRGTDYTEHVLAPALLFSFVYH